MKLSKVKKLLIDVKPSMRYDMLVTEFTHEFMNEVFDQTLFDYSDEISRADMVDVIMMAYTYRMVQEFKERDINIQVAISPSIHPNYSQWLMLVEWDTPSINVMPIIAKYFRWDRQETQNVMTTADLFRL